MFLMDKNSDLMAFWYSPSWRRNPPFLVAFFFLVKWCWISIFVWWHWSYSFSYHVPPPFLGLIPRFPMKCMSNVTHDILFPRCQWKSPRCFLVQQKLPKNFLPTWGTLPAGGRPHGCRLGLLGLEQDRSGAARRGSARRWLGPLEAHHGDFMVLLVISPRICLVIEQTE